MSIIKKVHRKNRNILLLIGISIVLMGSYVAMISVDTNNAKSNTQEKPTSTNPGNLRPNFGQKSDLLDNITPNIFCNPVCDGPW